MPIFRKSIPQDPLVVSMTGTQLGHRVLIAPSSRHDDVVMAIAAKVGLTGHVAIVSPDEARRNELAARALNAGLLVEAESQVESPVDEPPFDLAIVDVRGEPTVDARLLAGLFGRLRTGGRLMLLVPAPGGGLGALLRGGDAPPDTTAQTTALLAAGFRTARLLATRERIAFVEALKS